MKTRKLTIEKPSVFDYTTSSGFVQQIPLEQGEYDIKRINKNTISIELKDETQRRQLDNSIKFNKSNTNYKF